MTTKIEWTDETWNPVTGCTKVSQGCKNCYAERLAPKVFAGQRIHTGPLNAGTSRPRIFTDLVLHHDRLDAPLHWRKPRRIFVNSMSDLFHEDVPVVFIASVLGIAAAADWHTFQVLTKRPQRMLEVLASSEFDVAFEDSNDMHTHTEHTWPPKNIWLGVSVEDQETADERIPLLLQTPAAIRFLSCEPLLGPIDLRSHLQGHCPEHDFAGGFCLDRHHEGPWGKVHHLHWVIVTLLHQHRLIALTPPARSTHRAHRLAAHVEQHVGQVHRVRQVDRIAEGRSVAVTDADPAQLKFYDFSHRRRTDHGGAAEVPLRSRLGGFLFQLFAVLVPSLERFPVVLVDLPDHRHGAWLVSLHPFRGIEPATVRLLNSLALLFHPLHIDCHDKHLGVVEFKPPMIGHILLERRGDLFG